MKSNECILLQNTNKRALLYGIHTQAGIYALERLLDYPHYESVLVFAFQELQINHKKIQFVKIENAQMADITSKIVGDDLFLFQENEMEDTELFVRNNYLIPLRIALYAKHNGVNQVCLLSSSNTVLKTVFLPHKTKEELDQQLAGLNFWSYYVYKPAFVILDQKHQGVREKIANFIGKKLNALTDNVFKKFTPVETEAVIEMMLQNAQQLNAGIHEFNNEDILTFQESLQENS